MIALLINKESDIAAKIHSIFQVSYSIEAELLGATDFPPLKRTVKDFLESQHTFFGFIEEEKEEIAGVIEIDHTMHTTYINSLVVHPNYFRRGIAMKLITFAFNAFDSKSFVVETGADNGPAVELYKKNGFKEIKTWVTDHGIQKVQFEKSID